MMIPTRILAINRHEEHAASRARQTFEDIVTLALSGLSTDDQTVLLAAGQSWAKASAAAAIAELVSTREASGAGH